MKIDISLIEIKKPDRLVHSAWFVSIFNEFYFPKMNLNPAYISLPRVGPQMKDVSKYGPNGSSAAIMGFPCVKSKRFSTPA
jgi:hypothetical protein